jgi:hypothetical protein
MSNKSKSGGAKKRSKKREKSDAPTSLASPGEQRGLTHHGKRLMAFMGDSKAKGNFKDYVLFVGDQMIDAWGQYTIRRQAVEGAEPAPVVLVHKRDLRKIIGDDNAKRFWHRGIGKRTSYGAKRG